jgi:hypothetical protein
MSGDRKVPIPNGLLEAEMAAFPIASEDSFALVTDSLDPALGPTTSQLWSSAESSLLRTFIGIRIEDVVSIRDMEWFDQNRQLQTITQWFRGFVNRKLESQGVTFKTRSDAVTPSDPRWITRALPQDLLAAGLWQGAQRPIRFDDCHPNTALHLRDQGFAETHLHIGAGLEFGSHWIGTLLAFTDLRANLNQFASPGGVFGNGQQLGEWLMRAAIIRQLIGEYLISLQRRPIVGFEQFVNSRCVQLTQLGTTIVQPLRMSVIDVMRGKLSSVYSLNTMRWAFRRYCQTTTGYKSTASISLVDMDPLQPYFPSQIDLGASSEMQFIATALAEIERTSDRTLEVAFWQTMRIRNIYYRHLTQKALTPGLAWFVRYFDRIRAGRQSMALSDLAVIAAKVSGAGKGLRHFEFRTSPPERVDSGRIFLTDVFRSLAALQKEGLQEAGLVIHFIRTPGGGKSKGKPMSRSQDTYANPARTTNPRGYRFQTYAKRLRKQARTAARLLAYHPHLLHQFRGIDLCTDELAVPIWVFVDTFRGLRTVGERVSTYLAERSYNVAPLRRTVHAGEDFPHLLTGLRVVSDTVRRLDLQPGDRLGHAMALGLEPKLWSQSTSEAIVPREVRLFDLAWEWDSRTGPNGIGSNATRAGYLERQIADISEKIFAESMSPHIISQLADDLHNPSQLMKSGFPDGPRPNVGDDDRLNRLVRYLTDPELFFRGTQPIKIDTEVEITAMHELQVWVRGEVARRGLAVEINPTSNFLIGNLGEWRHHPLFRMNPPDGSGVNPVPLVVGSDDPLVFATGLPDEYPALARAMDQAGIRKTDANRWLDEVRSAGNQFRFTHRNSLDPWLNVPGHQELLMDIRNLIV